MDVGEYLTCYNSWYWEFREDPLSAEEFLPDNKIADSLKGFYSNLCKGKFSAKYLAAKEISRENKKKKVGSKGIEDLDFD
jgi:hypothetical protein